MASKPNILLITDDQHNADIMGCAGNPVVRTPHLDRLAADGVIFESAFTPHPLCTPARTTILTGQYENHHGVPYNINCDETRPTPPELTGLRAEAVAFPEALARQGYKTALFGKLHTKQAGDKKFGFQHMEFAEGKGQFVDYQSGPEDYRKYLQDKGYLDSAWRTWEDPEYSVKGHVTSPLPNEDYIDTWTAARAIDWIDSTDDPFFAWVSFSGPHTPWDPPEPFSSMYDPAEIPMPSRRKGELEEKQPQWAKHISQTIPAEPRTSGDPSLEASIEGSYTRFPDEQIRRMLSAYYGEISQIDAQVGRLLELLERKGLRENTLIIFTSDHGDYLGNNWAFFKHAAHYDSLARVPFIVSWPGCGSGLRSKELVSLIDVAPTILDFAGVESVDPLDGKSLRSLVAGDSKDWRDEIYMMSHGWLALVTKEKRYMRNGEHEELYDRIEDPHDLYNLAKKVEHSKECLDFADRIAQMQDG